LIIVLPGCYFLSDGQVFQKRQTAFKIGIKNILNSKYIKTEGFAPNFIEIDSKKISRFNVIGVVVQKSELDNYKTLTIDDGSGNISARIFENIALLDEIRIGDIVLVIGKPREFSSEKYLLIETIKKINPVWAKVRKLELGKKENSLSVDNENIKDETINSDPESEIVRLIKDLDKGNGVDIEEISLKDIKDMDKTVELLLKKGDLFEIKPGKLKVLE